MLKALWNIFFPINDSKMASYVYNLNPTHEIRGVVEACPLSFPDTGLFLKTLMKVGSDVERLRDLDRCVVDEIIHYRESNGANKDVHEDIMLSFHFQSALGVPAGEEDCRAVLIDRRPAQDANLGSSQASSIKLGKNTPPTDAVKIDANYKELNRYQPNRQVLTDRRRNKGHQLPYVQQFFVPAPSRERPSPFTILDVAILASVISQRAEHYSSRTHMCMWYATVFFLAARHIVIDPEDLAPTRQSPPQINEGRYFSDAGKFGNVRLVNPATGRLEWSRDDHDFDTLKEKMKRGMKGLEPAEIDGFMQKLNSDREKWTKDKAMKDPVREIIALFKIRRDQVRDQLAGDVAAAQERSTRHIREAEQRGRDEERGAKEAAERRAQEAERRAQEAERRAREAERQVLAFEGHMRSGTTSTVN